MTSVFPTGKLPAEFLKRMLKDAPASTPRLLVGPGIGLDCAVLDYGEILLVFKSDPITFATDQIGWYAVQINANDIATSGAQPRWFLPTLLLPQGLTTPREVERIFEQVHRACEALGITVIGGHTEITYGIDRPILSATMVGEVLPGALITPRGARPGDRLLLSKGVPIEATAILAREFSDRLADVLDPSRLQQAADYLFSPGISVYQDAQIACSAGRVTAMHDPTEGGLLTALWELSQASQRAVWVDLEAVPVPELARQLCGFFDLDPLGAIASGALLLTAPEDDSRKILRAWDAADISGAEIGWIADGQPGVWQVQAGEVQPVIHPERDEIAKLF